MENYNTIPEGKEIKQDSRSNRIRIEHIALNVDDPASMASWYCENLGMNIVMKGTAPANTRFISNASGKILLEVYNNPPDAVPDYASMNPLLLHIAFMVDDVEEICHKLTASGATVVDDVSTTAGGDIIVMLRDPWGIPIQFVKRAKPILPK
jgi:glyoxylase I family protein